MEGEKSEDDVHTHFAITTNDNKNNRYLCIHGGSIKSFAWDVEREERWAGIMFVDTACLYIFRAREKQERGGKKGKGRKPLIRDESAH